MKKIVEERKEIAFYIKMFPLKNHPAAYEKSKAILCEKSLTLLQDAHEGKPLPKASCETKVIDENIRLAEKLGISSLPTLVLPDGRLIVGYYDAKTLINMIGN
jgi:thiol:disulfide interchange protein DsbC